MTADRSERAAKTAWFPAGTKPVHVGVYQTRSPYAGILSFQRWDGRKWCAFKPTVAMAAAVAYRSTMRPNPTWRGLTKKAGR